MWTTTTAAVFESSDSSSWVGSIIIWLPTSTSVTLAPVWRAAAGVAKNVFVGIITFFPVASRHRKMISRALVPLFTATAYPEPMKDAYSDSNASV